MDECISEGNGCPSLEDVVNFVQEELGFNLSDEVIDVIYNCAESILLELGFGEAAGRKQIYFCPILTEIKQRFKCLNGTRKHKIFFKINSTEVFFNR